MGFDRQPRASGRRLTALRGICAPLRRTILRGRCLSQLTALTIVRAPRCRQRVCVRARARAGVCVCVRARAWVWFASVYTSLYALYTSDSFFADVDMAIEMKSRLSGADFVVIGAQDLSVLGRAAAPAAAASPTVET